MGNANVARMTQETNPWKAIVLEFIDFIRYKVESDRLTVGEAESIAKTFIGNLDLVGTADDFAAFWHRPKTNVTSIIDRKVTEKPARLVAYRFAPVRKAVPESWHVPLRLQRENHTKHTDSQPPGT